MWQLAYQVTTVILLLRECVENVTIYASPVLEDSLLSVNLAQTISASSTTLKTEMLA